MLTHRRGGPKNMWAYSGLPEKYAHSANWIFKNFTV